MQNIKIISLFFVGFSLGLAAHAGGEKHSTSASTKTTGTKYEQSAKDTSKISPSSAKVKEAQRALNEFGYDLEVDGVIGNQTRNAISSFQADQELKQTGVLDDATLAVLIGEGATGPQEGRLPASVEERPAESKTMDEGTMDERPMDERATDTYDRNPDMDDSETQRIPE